MNIVAAGNTMIPCLFAIREKGYRFWEMTLTRDIVAWFAKRDEHTCVGSIPQELLGLVAMNEENSPKLLDGDRPHILSSMLDEFFQRAPARFLSYRDQGQLDDLLEITDFRQELIRNGVRDAYAPGVETFDICLLTLRQKAYEIDVTPLSDDDEEILNDRLFWHASRGARGFHAYSPAQLLGLVTMWELLGDDWLDRNIPDVLEEYYNSK